MPHFTFNYVSVYVFTCFPSSLGPSLVLILLHSGWTHFKHDCAHYSVSTLLKGPYRFCVFTHHCSSLMQSNFWCLGSWVKWPLGRSLLPKAEPDCGKRARPEGAGPALPHSSDGIDQLPNATRRFSSASAFLLGNEFRKRKGEASSLVCPHCLLSFGVPLMTLPLCSLL